MLGRQLEGGNAKKSDSSFAWVRGEDMVISTCWFGDLEDPPVLCKLEACRSWGLRLQGLCCSDNLRLGMSRRVILQCLGQG